VLDNSTVSVCVNYEVEEAVVVVVACASMQPCNR
jgi:hypothetical protein